MKILVFSDSHSGLSYMRSCIRTLKPDVMIHLGDHFDDGEVIARENPHIPMHQVPGNCDRYRVMGVRPETLCYDVGGVKMYMTHGHNHGVKMGLYHLLSDARGAGAQIALYGHTHVADCHREDDGMWVLNPGSCGSYGGSCGLIVVENGKIIACRVLRQAGMD